MKNVKIITNVPVESAEKVRAAMAKAGAGRLGNYDHVSVSTRVIGRFRPLRGANPTIGRIGAIQAVKEERIEMLARQKDYVKIVAAIKKVHPYEEPAIEVMELLYPSTE